MARRHRTHRALVGLASFVCITLACGRDGQQPDEVAKDEDAYVWCSTEKGCELSVSAPTQVFVGLEMLESDEWVEFGRGAGWDRLEALGIGVMDFHGPRHNLKLELDPKLRLDALEVLIIRGVEVNHARVSELLARAPALEFLICEQCRGSIMLDFRVSPMLRAVSLESDDDLELRFLHTEHARQLELFSSTATVDPSAFAHARRLRVARLCIDERADLTPLAASNIEELWLRQWPWPDDWGHYLKPPATLPSGLAALQNVRALYLQGWGDDSGVALEPVLELGALQEFVCRGCVLGSEPQLPNLRHLDLGGSRMGSTEWAEPLDRLVSLNLAGGYLESSAGLTSLGSLVWLDIDGLWLPDDADLPWTYFVVGHSQPHSKLAARRGLAWTRGEPSGRWGWDTVAFTFRSFGRTPPPL